MELQQHLNLFEQFLTDKTKSYFPLPSQLNEAIHYSLLSEGKRIRPLLCLAFSKAFNGNQDQALACGMTIEMIHAYSLIHDDLPAMDNDDMRRGRPTNHKVYGEAHAILAGDSLLNMAPEFLLKELTLLNVDAHKILSLVTQLLEASGHQGMIKGQSLDMEFEKKDLKGFDQKSLESILNNIHKLKTGSLLTWSCLAGLHSHSDSTVTAKFKCQVESIGQRIGLLFQIVDDILDVTSDANSIGKTPGKDQKSDKLTYIYLYGLEKSNIIARSLLKEIDQDLETLKVDGDWKLVREILESLERKLNP